MTNKGKGKKPTEKETALVPSTSAPVVVEHKHDHKDHAEDIEIEDFPQPVLNRIRYLKTLHDQKNAIMEEYARERAVLEKKFNEKYTPLYATRSDIVLGKVESPTQSETEQDNKDTEKSKGIPHFWLTAMLHHEAFTETIEEEDIPALEHLIDLKCIDDEDLKGFTLEFFFSPNPFFTNEILKKSYKVQNLFEGSEPIISSVQSDKINWKSGKNLCVQSVKTKSKKGGKSKTQTKVEQKPSFFNFFKSLTIPAEGEEINVKQMQKLEEELEPDFDQALSLRTSIIPDAIIWYTGEAEGIEYFGDEDDGGEDDDEDGDEDDDDEDDEEETDKNKPVFNFKPPGAAPTQAVASTGAATEQAPECKQS
jgi:nucleosome assembly protein 1-like 1